MRTLPSTMVLCVASLWLAGCPGDDSSTDDGAATAASDTASSTTEPGPTTMGTTEPGTTMGTMTTEPGTTTEPTATTDATATTDSADSGTTGPGGAACGETECSDGEWCDFTDGICGAGGSGTAACEARPNGCPENYAPVCGCDGQVHGNDCDANAAGVDLDAAGDCETPEGYFRCGSRFCSLGFEFCEIQLSDIGGYGDSYACTTPMMECMGEITCDCLTEEFCFDFGCNPTADGGVEIVCPGG